MTLFNCARSGRGISQIDHTPHDMTLSEARELIAGESLYFDYLRGRCLKINLNGDMKEFKTALFNRDNGYDTAEFALIDMCINTNTPCLFADSVL